MNKVIIIGRPTKEPDVRYTNKDNEQLCIARYSLAVDRPGKDAGTDYINCVAFGRQGEFVEKYIKKGTKIAVEGRIQTGSYTDKDGRKVYTTDVVVERHEFCESKGTETKHEPEQPKAPEGEWLNVPEDIENTLPFK